MSDNAMIAGVGMGSVTINFLGWTVLLGLNSALDTLVSQSAGSGNLELCGVYLNRGRFVMTIFFIPIVFFIYQVEWILVSIGQNPEVSRIA